MCGCAMRHGSSFSVWWYWCVGWPGERSVDRGVSTLLLLNLDVLAEPGETFEDAFFGKNVSQHVFCSESEVCAAYPPRWWHN